MRTNNKRKLTAIREDENSRRLKKERNDNSSRRIGTGPNWKVGNK